jgi:hypothetical protein
MGTRTGEMVKDLGAHHDVDAPIGEREGERVPAHGEGHRLRAGARQLEY